MRFWSRLRRQGIRNLSPEEIRERITSFPRWHYEFDLKGNLTPIFDKPTAERHRQRKRYFFDPLVELVGGSLAGKRVLDLGCNAGFWSLAAVEAGCEFVLGIDGRQMHVDQANLVFEAKEVDKANYDFVMGNIFETDLRSYGTFDLVLCLGLLYHVSKHMELMEIIDALSSDLLVIDTSLSTVSGSFLELRREPLDEPRHAVDYELVMYPTREAVRDMVQTFGYQVATLKPEFSDWAGSHDYLTGKRRAFWCAKDTDLSRAPVETEPL